MPVRAAVYSSAMRRTIVTAPKPSSTMWWMRWYQYQCSSPRRSIANAPRRSLSRSSGALYSARIHSCAAATGSAASRRSITGRSCSIPVSTT
ncbi:Uncharacterised protein [Mycobacteroides abscessus subsp. abscessus]|nr:Uncharacterised protein [Mycobacteroides abscessus subsp. abscessus]